MGGGGGALNPNTSTIYKVKITITQSETGFAKLFKRMCISNIPDVYDKTSLMNQELEAIEKKLNFTVAAVC